MFSWCHFALVNTAPPQLETSANKWFALSGSESMGKNDVGQQCLDQNVNKQPLAYAYVAQGFAFASLL